MDQRATWSKDLHKRIAGFACRVHRTEEERQRHIVLAWWQWRLRGPFGLAVHWLNANAMRNVRAGRDLPGLARGHGYSDALRGRGWQGGRMGAVATKDAGPLRNAAARELVQLLLSDASELERKVMALLKKGYTWREVAERLKIGQRTLWDIIRRLRARHPEARPD